jgi:hypothetical protein
MLSLGRTILGWLTGSTLDRILTSVDNKFDNETERERIRAEIITEYTKSQVALLSGRGWWFPLLFLGPLGFWFAAVCIYSVFWCAGCIYPQPWSIADLPDTLKVWAGAMVSSVFLGKGVGEIVKALKR